MISLIVSAFAPAWAQSDRSHSSWKFTARNENRWLMETSLGAKEYHNEHHKKAVKAAKAGNWGVSLIEYEAAAQAISIRFEKSKDMSAAEFDLQSRRIESQLLSPFRFELALAYANRAEELSSFGRTREADSLANLAVFFLEQVQVYAYGRRSAGASFASLASAFSRLGLHDRAILYYRNALLNIEDAAPMSDPLQAVVNVRLGQEYLITGKIYESEPPLLRGTEFADSASAAESSSQAWCRQLASEGRSYLGEACRQMQRLREAESLYAASIAMALVSAPPMILPQCRPQYENYAKLLRERGAVELADSVNYWTDLIQRRAEDEVERLKRKD